MKMNNIKDLCLYFSKNEEFREAFINIKDNDPFRLAKKQEEFIIKNSNGFLNRLNNDYHNNKNFDYELDLKFGDFKDINGNYYDLKVGQGDYCGSINWDSLINFGDTKTNKHFYICVTNDFSRFYILNARKLKEKLIKEKKDIKRKYNFLNKLDYIGEKTYKNYKDK